MNALTIKHLTKVYKNGVVALKDISFNVKEGDFFGLLGANGAGKSTTIGIITSLINKTSGQVKVFGYDIDHQFSEAKACIGVVPQEFNCGIFEKCIDILTNQAGYYGIPPQIALERAEEYLKKLDLWHKRFSTPQQLSGGMKRRLMIARALVHRPKLLILDEPTAGVDIEIRRSMWHFLSEINAQGTTVILTTHYLEEAETLCRNLAIINSGIIIENSSVKTLLSRLPLETFVLNLDQPLHFVPELKHFRCKLVDETTLEVEISKAQAINELFIELSHHQINVLSMRNKANRLEELFLGLIQKNNGGQS